MVAQILLKKRFKHVDGLQPPERCQENLWQIMRSARVQIINDSNRHWLCISTFGCPPDTIDVYDSLKTTISPHVREKIAPLYHSPSSPITIRMMCVQAQTGARDCGLFAIATTVSLCYGIPPATVLCDQSDMRKQLLDCFKKGELTPFPAWDIPNPSIESLAEDPVQTSFTVDLYCSCRLPEEEEEGEMLQVWCVVPQGMREHS